MKQALLVLTLATAAVAQQQPKAPTPPAPVTAPDPNFPPKMTELQKTQLALYASQLSEINTRATDAAAPIQARAHEVIQTVETENPDWMWHDAAGPGDQSRFIKRPPPIPPAQQQAPATPAAQK